MGKYILGLSKLIFFLLGPFLALIFEFNITGHFLIGLWIDLTKGNDKKSSLKSFSLRY